MSPERSTDPSADMLAAAAHVAEESCGGYHSSLVWWLAAQRPDKVAEVVEERIGGEAILGHALWVKDRDEWLPVLTERCDSLCAEVRRRIAPPERGLSERIEAAMGEAQGYEPDDSVEYHEAITLAFDNHDVPEVERGRLLASLMEPKRDSATVVAPDGVLFW